jgi:putative hydrolase
MLSVDLHMHTNRSNCGLHTYLEMIGGARERGLRGICIADHGKFLGGPGVSSVFIRRFPGEYKGVRVWKGVEANALPGGETDAPNSLVSLLDLVLLGIHNLPLGESAEHYTEILVDAVSANPFVDILVHPDIHFYPIDIERVVALAAEQGMAVEFNNANLLYNKTAMDRMERLAAAVVDTGCRAVISGDSHAITEIGDDSQVRRALAEMGFADMQFVNDTFDSAEAFVEERREHKRQAALVGGK